MELAHVRWVRSGSADRHDAVAYAGQELAHYVRQLAGHRWDVQDVVAAGCAANTAWLGICDQMPLPPGCDLAPAPWDDGFAIWGTEAGLFIAGRNARSVLYGVYAFLEQQGVRYLRPGDDGEVVPKVAQIALPERPVIEAPRYRHRGVCIEGAPSIAHALGMVPVPLEQLWQGDGVRPCGSKMSRQIPDAQGIGPHAGEQ